MAVIEPRVIPFRGPSPRGHGAFVVRTAEEADAPAMLAHMENAVRTDPFSVRKPGEAMRTLDEQVGLVRAHREHPGQLLLVAVLDGPGPGDPPRGLIGALRFAAGERQRMAHQGYFGLSTHADWRGRGVGSGLIVTLLDWAAAHPVIEKVALGVLEGNVRAQALYRRLGFVEEARLLRYFKFGPGAYQDDVQMSMYVKPGVAPPGFLTWRAGQGAG